MISDGAAEAIKEDDAMSVFFMDFDMAPSVIWARDLYDQMQIRSDFRKWFPRMCQYGFVEGRDYEFVPRVRPQDEGGRTVQRYVKDYRITLEMAKQLYKLHHFHKNDCFRSCEGQHCMGTDHWMQAVIELLHQHKCKSHAPPKRFYESQPPDSLVTTTQIAKEYGCGAKVFNRLLHLHGIQYRANNQWVLYAKHQDKGYAKRKNLLMGSNPIIAPDSEMLWNAAIVWRILRRYEYTGALVMGRRKKIDVNTTSVRTLPEDKWIIAENAHEAIVTKDEYYQAQKAIRNVTPIQYKVDDDFALKGKICCGNCNRQLRHERQYGEMVFYCGYKRSAGKFSKCYGGYYREYSVNAKVARAIKTVFYALDVVNQGMQEKQSITVRCVDIEDLEKQAEAIRVEQIKLYESYADGVLRRDVYIEKKKTLSEKLAALQDSIRTEKEEQECADELDEEIRNLTKQASQKTYIGGLTKECVDAFVSMVYLYDDQTMKVEFNCEDVIRRALEKYGA